MNKVTVLQGQSLFDIAIQVHGSVEGALELAQINGISVSDELIVGQQLIISDEIIDSSVADYFEEKQTKIVSGENIIT